MRSFGFLVVLLLLLQIKYTTAQTVTANLEYTKNGVLNAQVSVGDTDVFKCYVGGYNGITLHSIALPGPTGGGCTMTTSSGASSYTFTTTSTVDFQCTRVINLDEYNGFSFRATVMYLAPTLDSIRTLLWY